MNKRNLPITLMFLCGILVTSVTYISRTPTSQLSFSGPLIAFGILCLITAAFPFIILRKVQDSLIGFGLIKARVTSPYWTILFVPALVFWGINLHNTSTARVSADLSSWNGKLVREFSWGGGELFGYEVLLLLIILFLHEIYLTVVAVADHKASEKTREQS